MVWADRRYAAREECVMADNSRETIWEYVEGEKTGTFYTAQRKWINKVHKWKEEFPSDVDVRHINEDGSVVVHLPVTWFRIVPKKPRNMSQEQRDALSQRMKNLQKNNSKILQN
jgi:hypothetical protein